MALRKFGWLLFSLFFITAGCTTVQHVSKADVNYTVVRAESAPEESADVTATIAPYKAQLDAVMNEELAVLPSELSKQKPESTLGNWVADVILDRLRMEGYAVDFAIVNYGGLRVPYLSAGPLTRRELFELSPFDNTLMVLAVPGSVLDSTFLLIAEADGWPVSKGLNLTIRDKKVVSAFINQEPLDPNRIYKVATLDYVANGGDNMRMLIPIERKDTGLLLRDILIEHVKNATSAGRTITSGIDGRIIKQ